MVTTTLTAIDMKTNRMVLSLLFMACILTMVSAQTYYYNTSKNFQENGYTYRCVTENWGYVTLFNTNNIHTFELGFKYKDGTSVTDAKILRAQIDLLEDDNWTKQRCLSIVDSAFTYMEKQRVGGEEFDVSMTINSNTGRVIEVDFRFYKDEPFATIPVSTYRKIEVALKNQVWFTPTAVGKQLQVLVRGWMHEVERKVENPLSVNQMLNLWLNATSVQVAKFSNYHYVLTTDHSSVIDELRKCDLAPFRHLELDAEWRDKLYQDSTLSFDSLLTKKSGYLSFSVTKNDTNYFVVTLKQKESQWKFATYGPTDKGLALLIPRVLNEGHDIFYVNLGDNMRYLIYWDGKEWIGLYNGGDSEPFRVHLLRQVGWWVKSGFKDEHR